VIVAPRAQGRPVDIAAWTWPDDEAPPRAAAPPLYAEGFERYLASVGTARAVWSDQPNAYSGWSGVTSSTRTMDGLM